MNAKFVKGRLTLQDTLLENTLWQIVTMKAIFTLYWYLLWHKSNPGVVFYAFLKPLSIPLKYDKETGISFPMMAFVSISVAKQIISQL